MTTIDQMPIDDMIDIEEDLDWLEDALEEAEALGDEDEAQRTTRRIDALSEPVVQEADGWYALDETWCTHSGPYATREEALAAVMEYAKTL